MSPFIYDDVSYKHRIVCYLLSHINACTSEFAQTRLLNSIAAVPNKAKIQILLPTIQASTKMATSIQPADTSVASSEKLTIQLLLCFDAAAAHLNDNPSAWDLFLSVIRTYLRSGATVLLKSSNFFSLSTCIYLRNAAVDSTNTRPCHSEWFVFIFKSTTENRDLRSFIGNWLAKFLWGMFFGMHR